MDLLDAARAVLPLWVSWAFLPAALLFTFGSAFAVVWLVQLPARRALRRAGAAHWSERAQRVWPSRQAGIFGLLVLPALSTSLALTLRPVLLAGPGWLLIAPMALAAFLGAGLGARALEVRARPTQPPGAGEWVGNRVLFVLLFAPHFLLASLLALYTPAAWTLREALPWGAGVALLLGVCLFGALPVLWPLGVLRPASPRLVQCMQRAAATAGLQPRRVLQLRGLAANAFANPNLQSVVVTERALALLSDDELTAVCAHELGHLRESAGMRTVRFATAAGMSLPLAATVLLDRALGPPGLLLCFAGTVFVPLLARRALSRAEVHADHVAHGASVSEQSYARALERLHEDALMPANMAARTSIHPPLYERMLAAGVTPDFPRPPPPSRLRGALGMVAVVALVAPFIFAGMVGLQLAAADWGGGDEASLLRALAWGPEAAPLAQLAHLRESQGRDPEALALLAAAEQLEPGCASHASAQSRLLAHGGQCEQAARTAQRALYARGTCRMDEAYDQESDLEALMQTLADCDRKTSSKATAP